MPGWSPARKDIVVRSLEEYVKAVSALRQEWLDDPLDELWFRGEDEKHHETTLWPELFRSTKPLADILDVEDRLFEEFKRCGVQYSDFDPDDQWNWYYIMQHHGGPTRLLDWSDGSLMAAHFATRSKAKPDDLKLGAVVYVLDPHWLVKHLDGSPALKKHRKSWEKSAKSKGISEDDLDEEYENTWLPGSEEDFREEPLPSHLFLLDTEQITRRVAAQRSRFMVFGHDKDYLRNLAGSAGARLQVIRIPGECVQQMQIDIRDCGVTESVIFPDLDGMGREIKQLWERFKATA